MVTLLSAGCVIRPDGRPVGADVADGLARLVGVGPWGCPPGRCGGDCGEVCNNGYVAPGPECDTDCDAAACGSGDCGETADAGYVAPCESEPICVKSPRRSRDVAPAEMMPPGRFFPVPTHPVFQPVPGYGPLAPCNF